MSAIPYPMSAFAAVSHVQCLEMHSNSTFPRKIAGRWVVIFRSSTFRSAQGVMGGETEVALSRPRGPPGRARGRLLPPGTSKEPVHRTRPWLTFPVPQGASEPTVNCEMSGHSHRRVQRNFVVIYERLRIL